MDKKVIELAREAGMTWASGLNGSGYHINHPNDLERFYELAVAEERKKYDKLLTEYERLANVHMLALSQNHNAASMSAAGAVFDFQERLADAIEQMPFGDTATSFAVFVRNFK